MFGFTEPIARLSGSTDADAWPSEIFEPAEPDALPTDRSLERGIAARRFRVGLVVTICLLLLFAARAAQLQIIEGPAFREIAEENRFRAVTLPSTRGMVMDRYGQTLIENVSAFTLLLRINELPEDPVERSREFDRVADLAGLQRTDLDLLLQEYASAPGEDVIVKKTLDYTNAMLAMVEEETLPGFSVVMASKRRYLSTAPSLSHVLGYMGKIDASEFAALQGEGYRRTDEIGKTGVEKSLESTLRGNPGRQLVEVDASGSQRAVYERDAPTDGQDVALSIDLDLQEQLEASLRAALETSGARRGSALAIDPSSGEVLAMVSWPTFDANVFAGGVDAKTYASLVEDQDRPLFPRAIAGEFPSGSTFKPFVAAAALAEGLITPATSFLSVGGISIGPWFFPDWKAGGHGVTDVRKAIAESVNTFFYAIGGGLDAFQGLGVERITAYARQFGFGEKTGIGLPGEADGFLPSKQWKEETKGERWYVGDTYHLAIGQGDLLVTPLQLAVATATVANGGTRWKPTLVHAIDSVSVSPQGTELSDELRSAISVVREGMRQTVTSGSARSLSLLSYPVAGKTGTAQTGEEGVTHAWFTGFAPYENPRIALTILLEEGGEGSSFAVPVARDVFSWWFANRQEFR